jgi:hypothetical protein
VEGQIPGSRGGFVVGHVALNPFVSGVGHLPVGQLPMQSPAGPIKGLVHTPLAAALVPKGGDALTLSKPSH